MKVSLMRERFPWSEIMAFGFGQLKLSPAQFWSMTPRELDASISGYFGSRRTNGPPDRVELETLMRHHPDKS